MTRRLAFAVSVLWLLVMAAPQAVGTVTVTPTPISDLSLTRYSFAWTSDGSGNVSGNAQTLAPGLLFQIRFVPNGGGTAPTDLYDVTLVNANGIDFLAGVGANLSATVSTQTRVASPLIYDGTGTLDLVVANAGATKGGTVVLWLETKR